MCSAESRGSTLQALLHAAESPSFPARVSLLVATRRSAPAVRIASESGVPVAVLSPTRLAADGPEAYASAIISRMRAADIDLICLAGYMLRLPAQLVHEFPVKIMNVHAALLPLFGGQGMYGLRVHQAVLESGMKVTGCTVHFVDEEYDTGPVIVQRAVPVHTGDTPETLGARLLPEEHRAVIHAVRLFAEGRLRVVGRCVEIIPR
ncbi:MAG: phosphoribosylglycinamide formyltransferase [Armatimonadetes bacterium]|nr:phosphoribosylglycinamide formyltransferase [Armatimonadota bacterium]MDE2206970.1 phosphoribosylglycinamide formyltransferase [Armatimonadota bacterium]